MDYEEKAKGINISVDFKCKDFKILKKFDLVYDAMRLSIDEVEYEIRVIYF